MTDTTTAPAITAQELEREIRKLAVEQPDRTEYVGGRCIRAFAVERLARDRWPECRQAGDTWPECLKKVQHDDIFDSHVDRVTWSWIDLVQSNQDSGDTWKVAVSRADGKLTA